MSGQCDCALIGSLSCLSHVALSTAAYEQGERGWLLTALP